MKSCVSFVGCGVLLFSIALSSVAVAQDAIVVTAERRDQSINDIPASIAVIDRDQLVRLGADHIAEALARAPGVNLHRGSGAEHLTSIRSPVLTAGAGAGSFLFLENGVPLRSAGFANINGLFDAHFEIADSIEIVRGPSGALYGANAIHGVVNVLTPLPSSEGRSVFVDVFGDTEDRYKWRGSISDRRGNHGFFAGGSITSESGYRANAGLDQQKLTLRHLFDGDTISVDTIFSFDNLEQETAGFIFGRADLFDRDQRRTNDFPEAFRDAKSARLQSSVLIDLGNAGELRITPYARWNDMDFLQHFLPGQALEENGHWSVGFQSAYYRDIGRFSLITGLDAEYTQGTLREFQSNPTVFSFVQGLHYDYQIEAINSSAFAQMDYALSDKTTASAALRVDGTVYEYDNRTDDGIFGRFLRLPDQRDDFVTASPKFSLRHEFSEDLSVYGSYARGARPPQTTDLYRIQINQTGDRARPEKIDAFELGVRSTHGDWLSVELAGFFMDKRNFFFRDADGFNVADGKTRHTGVEASVRIELHDTLSLLSDVTWAKHTYRFDRLTGNSFESISFGDDVDTAPRVIANTRLVWQPIDALSFEAEWRSLGSYFTDAANANSYEGYDLINVRGEARLTNQLSAYVSLRNAGDELYAERADFAFGSERFFPGEVRTLGVGLRFAN